MPFHLFARPFSGRSGFVLVGCLLIALWAFLAAGCHSSTVPPAALQPASPSPAIQDTPTRAGGNLATPGRTPTGGTPTGGTPTDSRLASTPTPVPPTPSPTSRPVETALECRDNWCVYPGHSLESRPIAGPGGGPVDHTYPYAALRLEYPKPHSGVELQAPAGEVVVAAAPGRVVTAGNDRTFRYGYVRNFYGRLVILEHDLPAYPSLVYTLYAHLEQIDVEPGDEVHAGQPIGRVGAAGRATGPHLHFEVRLGEPSLKATRNPEFWLPTDPQVSPPTGILAGSVLDRRGQFCTVDTIVLQPILEGGEPAGKPIYLTTYQGTWWQPDDLYLENFAMGDLPVGAYQVSFVYLGQLWSSQVEVFPGKVTVVRFAVNPPD